MFDFNQWIRQPTTIHGLAVVAGGAGVAISHLATGSPYIDFGVGVIGYVLVHLGIDDHSALEQAATSVTADALQLAQRKVLSPIQVVSDARAVAEEAEKAGLVGRAAAAIVALALAGSLLTACAGATPEQQATINQALTVICDVDGVVVPIGQPIVASIGPTGATLVSLDTLLVHPAVMNACQKIGGTPKTVTPASVGPVAVPAPGPALPASPIA